MYIPFDILVIVVFLLLGYGFGQLAEKNHYRSIRQRETQLQGVHVFGANTLTEKWQIASSGLVQGNVVVSVAFTPVFRDKAETPPEELAAWRATNDSLGITFEHPEIAFVPGLGIRAALPEPLGGEDRYILHFGTPDEPLILWQGQAGTGRTLQDTRPLSATDIQLLGSGQPVVLTALKTDASGADEIAWAIAISEVNQAGATQTLLGYMANQLSVDLNKLLTPRG